MLTLIRILYHGISRKTDVRADTRKDFRATEAGHLTLPTLLDPYTADSRPSARG